MLALEEKDKKHVEPYRAKPMHTGGKALLSHSCFSHANLNTAFYNVIYLSLGGPGCRRQQVRTFSVRTTSVIQKYVSNACFGGSTNLATNVDVHVYRLQRI